MTILYVDDDRDDAEVFCEAIEFIDSSFHCKVATSGKEAISMLYRPCPDFIFLDYRMPQQDGREILTEIRTHVCFAYTKVIMYSSFMRESEIAECLELGAHECMQKSAAFADLCNNLNKLLKGTPL